MIQSIIKWERRISHGVCDGMLTLEQKEKILEAISTYMQLDK